MSSFVRWVNKKRKKVHTVVYIRCLNVPNIQPQIVGGGGGSRVFITFSCCHLASLYQENFQFAYLDHKFIIFLILLKSSLITVYEYMYFLMSVEYGMFPIIFFLLLSTVFFLLKQNNLLRKI